MLKYKRVVSLVILLAMILSLCSTVFAEEESQFGYEGVIPEEIAIVNGQVFEEFYKTVDEEKAYNVDMKYDTQGRIIEIITKCENVQENIIVSYDAENKFSFQNNKTELETPIMTINEDISLMSSIGNYDYKMTDAAVKNRIAEAQSVWNNNVSMRDAAHKEAEIARADYCAVYPKSTFASLFLETGNLSNGTYFRRTMKYTNPQMYGSDIIALQRVLMALGYMESTDVKTDEYGYFGPTTEQAVKEYQSDHGLSADGIAGNSTIKKVFGASESNNKSQVTFEGLNKINVFRLKHDAVCTVLATKLGPTIYREAFISGAGLKGRGGRADVIRVSGTSKMVWEVKPDSIYGKATGAKQVATYVNQSSVGDNLNRVYCPVTYGSDITAFSFPWSNGRNVYVSSYCSDGTRASGVVFYSDRKGLSPIWQPSYSPVVVPKPNEDYKTITWPEPQTVYQGLVTAGVAVASFYIIKGVIALVASVPSGGSSLLLLCF